MSYSLLNIQWNTLSELENYVAVISVFDHDRILKSFWVDVFVTKIRAIFLGKVTSYLKFQILNFYIVCYDWYFKIHILPDTRTFISRNYMSAACIYLNKEISTRFVLVFTLEWTDENSFGFRYQIGGLIFPLLKDWLEKNLGGNLEHKTTPKVSEYMGCVCFLIIIL